MTRKISRTGFLWLLIFFSVTKSFAAQEDAQNIIRDVETLLWGKTVQGEYEMTIRTPYWQRTLKMNLWMRRPDKSFIRILSPAKEKGIASLRIKDEMWNYLPKVERILKVPPSMMLQPWMGSDFSNDDLVKESSVITDYTQRINKKAKIENQDVYFIELIPKPNVAVVWGKLMYLVRVSDHMPLKMEYYNERGTIIKTLTFSDVKTISGRKIPTQWQMRSVAKPEDSTTIIVKKAIFDKPIAENIFSLRNLRKR